MKLTKKQMSGITVVVFVVVAVVLLFTVFKDYVGLGDNTEGFYGGIGYNATDKGFFLGESNYNTGNSSVFNFVKGFNSNHTCRNLETTYLSSVDDNNICEATATKVAVDKFMTVHIVANLPDSQSTFEYTRKDKCDCHCNGNFDCYCGTGGKSGCPYYMGWVVDEVTGSKIPLGKMTRMRDGKYRVERKFAKDMMAQVNSHHKVVVTFEGNLPDEYNKTSYEVVVGYFNKHNSICS